MFVDETEKSDGLKSNVKDILKYNAVSKKYLNWMMAFTWGNMKK